MTNKLKRRMGAALAILALLLLWMPAATSNSAEPPRVVVYFAGGVPQDTTVYVVFSDGSAQPMTQKKAGWERYDLLYKYGNTAPITALRVEGGGASFDISVEGLAESTYNNLFTLDIAKRTVSQGKNLLRSILLIALRVGLTLVLEGLVFFLFGYRLRRSWLIFLVANLVTQGVLNAVLSSALYPTGYEIIGLIFGEIFVFAAEMIAYPILLREHGRGRAVLAALAANAVSLVAGGFMLTYIPL